MVKLVAKDGKIVDTPPEPPVEIPEDPGELKALAIKTVVDQLSAVGKKIFSDEMHAGAILTSRAGPPGETPHEERQRRDKLLDDEERWGSNVDYIIAHKEESPFNELWQQLNVKARVG